jgi:uncharacterized integral membrane protein
VRFLKRKQGDASWRSSGKVYHGEFGNPKTHFIRIMFKWLLAIFIAVFILGVAMPKLAGWLRLGRLPGDVSLRWRGQVYQFPLASTVLLSLLLGVLLRFLKI